MRSHKELMEAELTQDWLINGVLPRGGLSMVAGQPKVGKSLYIIDVCNAIGDERIDFLHGFAIEQRGPVLYANPDMPTTAHRRRFRRLEDNHQFKFGNLWHITRDEFPPGFDILKEGGYQWLATQIEKLQPALIVYDVIRRFYTGDENSSDIAAQVIQKLNDLNQLGNSSGLLVHHTNKTNEIAKNMGIDKDPVNAVRGSSVLAGSMDTIIAFNDIGNELVYQGRDLNVKYNIKRNKAGLHHRWIKEKVAYRATALERFIARFIIQKPEMDADTLFSHVNPHVENLSDEEFLSTYSRVKSNIDAYEWI